MNRNSVDNIKKSFITALSIVVLLISLKAFWNNFSRLKAAFIGLKEKEMVVENLKRENENIKNRIEQLSSDLYMERKLRDNLRMAKEGEIVVILPDDEELEKIASDFVLHESVEEKDIWQRWMEVFNFY